MSSSESQLIDAAKGGDCDRVRTILATYLDLNPNLGDANGYTPMNCASWFGHLPVVEVLAGHPEVDVNQGARINETPLFVACQQGHLPVIQHLLTISQVLVNKTTVAGASPLYIACEKGHPEVVRVLLLDHRVNPNRCRDSGASPLFIACQEGKADVVKLLLMHKRVKVDVNRPRNDGVTPLWMASQKGHFEIVKWILSGEQLVNTTAKWSGNNYPAARQARLFGHDDIAQVIEHYQNNPDASRHALRRELGISGNHSLFLQQRKKKREKKKKKKNNERELFDCGVDVDAANVFCSLVFLCDDYLRIADPGRVHPNTLRFLRIARDLPMELQMVLSNRMFGIARDIVALHRSEAAFRTLIQYFESPYH